MEALPRQGRSHPSGVHRRDLGQDKHDTHARALHARQAAGRKRAPWSLAHAHFPRRPAFGSDCCTLCHRRPDQRRKLPCLYRASFGADAAARRYRHHRQSRQPQRQGHSPRYPGSGRQTVLPPSYSPDLNPIEQVFAKLKTLLRKAAERTVEATWKRIGALLDTFTSVECTNYLKNAGYASI